VVKGALRMEMGRRGRGWVGDEVEMDVDSGEKRALFDFASVKISTSSLPRSGSGNKVRFLRFLLCASAHSPDSFFSVGEGKIEYGNFPAPPRAHRELKSGNLSRTFK
jgi:hypothetical protein